MRPAKGSGLFFYLPPCGERTGDLKPMLLTSREAAFFLRIGRTKLGELTRSGDIPAYRLGDGRTSPLRYKKTELVRWLERNRLDFSGSDASGPRSLPRGR